MKIAVISDTHSYHRKIEIPEINTIDTIVCVGDISFRGELDIIEDFANWMKELPMKNKISVFGNHEVGLRSGKKRHLALKMFARAGIHYLENSAIKINGLNFWGSPCSPNFHDWEFQFSRGEEAAALWANIPNEVDILISHTPPHKILDEAPRKFNMFEHVGCEELRKVIDSGRLKNLKAVLMGHIHNSSGITEYNGIKMVNASICTEAYKPTNPVRVIEI